ncbi:hypothetical protein CDAR_75251 [Caerostris darwini]|uniref:Uncharacterized protein n=1 Tax=Caerostris darwini TaxID=1538125 RepID=A0AAV4WI54_9ARAC|nr:hypothetical protein CDAR_75251 [Caerostris darwini]
MVYQALPYNSKSCPQWLLKKQIQTIKVKQNISYAGARKLIKLQNLLILRLKRVKISFASIAIQTDDICYIPVQKHSKRSTAKSKSTNTAHNSDKLSTSPKPSTSSSSAYKLPATLRHTNYKL